LINTTDSTVGTVVEHQQVVDLPLNGRQFTQLMLLSPGASPQPTGQQPIFHVTNDVGGISPAVNGNRADFNNFTIDGVENNELFFNGVAISPPPDAIQEFKVQTAMNGGEFGRGPGANTNIVTRSGGNEIHGSVWEFLRNDKFDARNFFNDERSPFRQNQFGVTAGGPIRKDKAWLFGWYEGLRKNLASSLLSTVPTPAELQGDLSDLPVQIFNPLTTRQTGTDNQGNAIFTRDPFAGNRIPSNMINPAAALLSKFYPTPNIPNAAPGEANYINK